MSYVGATSPVTEVAGNRQRSALKDILSLYAVTMGGADGSKDTLPIANGTLLRNGQAVAVDHVIRNALFGSGAPRQAGQAVASQISTGLIAEVLIGDRARNNFNTLVTSLTNLGLSTTRNSDSHWNHFHIYLRPPERFAIGAPQNINATGTPTTTTPEIQDQENDVNHLLTTLLGTALTMGVPGDALAAAARPPQATASAGAVATPKIARSFHTCRIVTGASAGKESGYWPYDGIPAQIYDALGQHTDYDGFIDEIRQSIRLWQAPNHGQMIAKGVSPPDGLSAMLYKPNPGFEGVDTGILAFEVKGKTYLSVQKFIVSIPRSEKPLPWDCKEAWKLPPVKKSDSGLPLGDAWTVAQLDQQVLLAGLVAAMSGVNDSFVQMSGSVAATTLGQGSTAQITLDTDAAGHGWYIDPTPLNNTDDYLPTGDSNVWQAKPGNPGPSLQKLLAFNPALHNADFTQALAGASASTQGWTTTGSVSTDTANGNTRITLSETPNAQTSLMQAFNFGTICNA